MQVLTKHGLEPIDESKINLAIESACEGLENVDWSEIAIRCKVNWYDGITTDELSEATILAALELLEIHPNYDYVAARLLLNKITKEFQGGVDLSPYLNEQTLSLWPRSRELCDALDRNRDKLFRYQGVKILYDRYLLRDNIGTLLESPQMFFMRIAAGIASVEEKDQIEWAIKFYNLISKFDYMPSTPTLFNAGLKRPQMASCYVQHVPDSLKGIFDAYSDMAEMAKWAGGIGTNWSHVRSAGSKIVGTNGNSTGLIPWLKIQNDIAIAVNQGGKRRGSHCAYIEPWHKDIEEFLDLRKGVGDERRRTHDLDTALWIPDIFMERVQTDGEWTLFCPSEAPILCDTWGEEFAEEYRELEDRGWGKKVKARDLWKKILTSLYETGHPWVCFKDRCNEVNPLKSLGMIRSSNLCTEITLNTSNKETAVCNLGSINLANHVEYVNEDWNIDTIKLINTTHLAVRMLDNVITGMFYPTEKAERTNTQNRPIGLGIMGWQDCLYRLGLDFDGSHALAVAEHVQRIIKDSAEIESIHLARERGAFPTCGLSVFADAPRRHSYLLAIAPTATISNIVGTTPSIEPMFSNLFVQSNLSGDFTNINRNLVYDLEQENLWTEIMRNRIKFHNGSIQNIDEISTVLKKKYRTAFELDQRSLIDLAAARQKYICQSQSLNLYTETKNGKELSDLYFYAWKKGIKTTYYLRTKAASGVEKSTVDPNAYGKTHMAQVTCKITEPDCEACQ